MSLPFWNSSLARTSLRGTGIILLFGISIPTADLPGIGASMRICVAASAIASSFDKPSILLTLTPISGLSSNLVTVGPTLALITFALHAKACQRRFNDFGLMLDIILFGMHRTIRMQQ